MNQVSIQFWPKLKPKYGNLLNIKLIPKNKEIEEGLTYENL